LRIATDDLDFFTLDEDAFERSRHVLPELARATSCEASVRVEAPAFRRWALTRSADTLIVDTVLDRSKQRVGTKLVIDDVAVDPPEEIIANKLAAIVGPSEERDLVDLMSLKNAGYSVEDALPAALAKDGGATPAAIAWLLSEVVVPDDARLPGVTPAALRAYVDNLVRRLRKLAHPAP
jgi:hypothetical protein